MAPDAEEIRKPRPKAEVRRQAIVLVHGMGEQVPMETVRDFAKAIWQTDSDLHARDINNAGELFSVPDSSSGSRELRRLSTRKSRPRVGKGDAYSIRSEFFELYWADSTNGTTWYDFLRWYARLVFRRPSEVPPAVKWIWVLLWITNVVFVLAVEIAALWLVTTEIDEVFMKAVATARDSHSDIDWMAAFRDALGKATSKDTIRIMGAAALASFVGYFATRTGLLGKAAYWLLGVGLFVTFWCVIVLAGLLLKPVIFMPSKDHPVFWAGFVVLISTLLLLLQGFLVRFFGDVARYTIASPGNIVPRQKVRDRGVALIKQLSATDRYDRIVVVAHSLGCIIAYDILTLLWSDYVSTRNRSPDSVPTADAISNEIQAVVDASNAHPFELDTFRRAQRSVFRSIRKADNQRLAHVKSTSDEVLVRWLISDLVTIACPLTHAEFLLARTNRDLKDRFRWRELSTCPPKLEDSQNGKSLAYRKDGIQHSRLLHDSVFAAVRWTSIHDQPESRFWFMTGDCISGPIAGLFGPGIADIKVAPRWASPALPERFFTHTIYWEMVQSRAKGVPRSVDVIRKAVNLLDEDAAEDELVAEAKRTAKAASPRR